MMKLLILPPLLMLLILAMACGESVEPYPLSASQAQAVQSGLNETMPPYAVVTNSEFKTLCNNFKSAGWDADEAVASVDPTNERSRFAHQGLVVWLWDVSGQPAEATPGLLAGFCAHIG